MKTFKQLVYKYKIVAIGFLSMVSCVFDTSPYPFHGKIEEIRVVASDSLFTTYSVKFSGENTLDTCCAFIEEKVCWPQYLQRTCGIKTEIYGTYNPGTCNGKQYYRKGIYKDSVLIRLPIDNNQYYVRLKLRSINPWSDDAINRIYNWELLK